MNRTKQLLTWVVLAGAILLTGALIVQASPGEQNTGDACDAEHLIAEQAAYAAMLDDFADAVEHDLDAALSTLYEVGHTYQHLATDCGFVAPDDDHAADDDDDMAEDHMDDDHTEDAHEEESEHEAEEHDDEHVAEDEHDEEAAQIDLAELAYDTGDPSNGEVLFNTMQTEVGFACATCHRVNSAEMLVGPGLLGVVSPEHEHSEHGAMEEGESMEMTEADMAMDTLRRTDPVTYLRISILSPNAYIVPGFLENLMPQTFGEVFNPEEINDLIAYVLTLSE